MQKYPLQTVVDVLILDTNIPDPRECISETGRIVSHWNDGEVRENVFPQGGRKLPHDCISFRPFWEEVVPRHGDKPACCLLQCCWRTSFETDEFKWGGEDSEFFWVRGTRSYFELSEGDHDYTPQGVELLRPWCSPSMIQQEVCCGSAKCLPSREWKKKKNSRKTGLKGNQASYCCWKLYLRW